MKPRALLLILCCCTPLFASKEKPVIGFSLDELKEERWQHDRDIFVAEVARLGGTAIVQSANSDDTRQVRDIESLLSRGVDVLVIVPHNGAALARVIKSANDARVPVIAYDRMILNAKIDYYLSFDNVKVGEAQASYVAAHLPAGRKAQVVRVYGGPNDNNAHMVKKGQDNILLPLVKSGAIEVIHEDWALEWKPENAKKIVNAAITRHGHAIDAIVTSNDSTAAGAVQALMEEGLAGKVIVTGQDAELSACQRILRGTQSMTVYKPLRKLATNAADVAVELARGKTPPAPDAVDNGLKQVPATLVPVIIVDRNNLESTVIADNFHRADQLR